MDVPEWCVSFFLKKVDGDGKPLANVAFTLYNFDGTKVVQKDGKDVTAFTDEKGDLTFKGITLDEYVLKETKALAGYTPAEDVSIALTANKTVKVTNVKIPMCTQPMTVTGDKNGENCMTPVTVKIVECPDFTVYYEGPKDSVATFTLRKVDGTIVEENIAVQTDDNGKATLHFTEDACNAALTVRNTVILPVTEEPTPEQPKDECEKPVINVTPSTGDKPAPGTNVTVTVDGTTTTGKVTDDGTVSFDHEPTVEPGKTINVTVDRYEPTTTTVNDQDCTTTVTITPIEKACDHFTVHVIDEDGQPIKTIKVTVAGDTVKTTNGTYTFDRPLTPGTAITFTKNNYEEEVVYVSKDSCDATVTLTKVQPTVEDDAQEPTTSTTPEDEFSPDSDEDVITPSKEDKTATSSKNDTTDFDTTTSDDQKSTHKGGATKDDVSVDHNDQSTQSQQKSDVVDEPTVEDKATNKAATPTLLPQTGEQIMLYSLLGMMLIGAAFFLFKRSRRKAS